MWNIKWIIKAIKTIKTSNKTAPLSLLFVFIMCIADFCINFIAKHICNLLQQEIKYKHFWNQLRTPEYLIGAKKAIDILEYNLDFLRQIGMMFIGFYVVQKYSLYQIAYYQLGFSVAKAFSKYLLQAAYPFTAAPFALTEVYFGSMIFYYPISISITSPLFVHSIIQLCIAIFDFLWLYVRLILNIDIIVEFWFNRK